MTYTDIKEYISLSKEDRCRHVDLSDPCIEIGGSSYQFKGMMAHVLKTTVPVKQDKIHLCHACHNAKCSNQKHLYWGTMSDNVRDSMKNGTWKNPWIRVKEKYGNIVAKQIWTSSQKRKENAKSMGMKYGGWNKLSEERLQQIKEVLDSIDTLKFGWVQIAANKLNVSHSQVKRYLERYFPEKVVYTRKKI